MLEILFTIPLVLNIPAANEISGTLRLASAEEMFRLDAIKHGRHVFTCDVVGPGYSPSSGSSMNDCS